MTARIRNETPFAIIPEWLLYSGVTANAVRLYAVLHRHADREGHCRPKQKRLAELMGCSIPTVERALQELKDAGAVEAQQRQRADGTFGANEMVVRQSSPSQVRDPSITDEVRNRPSPVTEQELEPVKQELLNEREPNGSHTLAITNGVPTFEDFYTIYPRHAEPERARKAWDKALAKAPPRVILAGALRYRDDPNRTAEFTKHPATWLNAGCWADDPLPSRNGSRVRDGAGETLRRAAQLAAEGR